MIKRKFNPREKILLFITMAVVLFAILLNFTVLPFIDKNDLINKEILITRIKLKKYQRLLNRRETIEGRYPPLPVDDSMSGALAELENMANESGLKILEVRPQDELIDIRTEGNIEQQIRFIYNIQNSLALLWVRSFQINAKADNQLLEANFTITK